MAVLTTACDNLIDDRTSGKTTEALLEVEVNGLNPLYRSVIEGSTLPDDSSFGIYVVNSASFELIKDYSNVETFYSGGKCRLSRNVDLSCVDNTFVYAFYPYTSSGNLDSILIDAISQTDYLWGRSVASNGSLTHVNASNTKANIHFEHIMALITLRIHKSEDNSRTYMIPSISFDGDGWAPFRSAYVNVLDRTFVNKNYEQFQPIEGTLSSNTIDDTNDVIYADFLIIPYKPESNWPLCINFSGEKQYFWDAMPAGDYESGKHYIYDCVILADNTLTIKSCQIEEWSVIDMPERNAEVF